MGMIDEHMSSKPVKDTQAGKAGKRGLRDIYEGLERLKRLLDREGGDNGFDVEVVGASFLGAIKETEVRVQSGEKLAFLSPAGTLPAGSGTGTSPAAPSQPSRAEMLGEKLEKICGNRTDAVLNLLGHALQTNPMLIDLLTQATARAKNGEELIREHDRVAFQVDLDERNNRRTFEKGFMDLMDLLHGGTAPDQSVAKHLTAARRLIEAHRAPVTPDETPYFDAVKRLSGIASDPGEDFGKYIRRAVGDAQKKGSLDTFTVQLDKVGKTIGHPRGENEANATYAMRIDKELARLVAKANAKATGKTGDYSQLLDEIGTAIGCPRNTAETDDALLERVKLRLTKVMGDSEVYWQQHASMKKYCDDNSIAVAKTDTPYGMFVKVAEHWNTFASAATPQKGGRLKAATKTVMTGLRGQKN